MIIRTRRKNESLIGRIFGSASHRLDPTEFLEEKQFQQELLKEIYRSDRRASDREFGLVRIVFPGQTPVELDDQVMKAFRSRLRVTDSIGCYDACLAILLPETSEDDTLQVANSIAEVAHQYKLTVDTEISVYPWDDELIALSDELKMLAKSDRHDSFRPSDPASNDGHSRDASIESSSQQSSQDSEPSTSAKMSHCQQSHRNVIRTSHSFVRSLPTPWWKRGVDIVCSCAGLLILSPVFIGAAIAIKSTSAGPIFFRQLREGKNGKPFGILKFRTMIANAEEKQADLRQRNQQDGPAFKLANDPRVTKVGKYLRQSCIDELPQLFNVLLGEMSLVGPRPLPMCESYACHAWQRARLRVLPGLTCTWQTRSGRDVTFAQWMRMDLDYIRQRSFWFDLKLILKTAFVVLMHRGSV